MQKPKRGGRSTFSGTNAQALAAFSLFLQHLRDVKFSHIELEAPGFEDFNLVFDTGKKIICESKAWNTDFGFAQLKGVLENIASKQNIGDGDEILIVCKKVKDEFISKVKYSAYFEKTMDTFRQKGFRDQITALLPRVRFYRATDKMNKEIIYSLLAEAVGFWLPRPQVERIAHDLLFQKILEGSAHGSTYSRQDIFQQIQDLATEAKNDSVYYDDQLKKRDDEFRELEQALTDHGSTAWKPKELSAFSTKSERLVFAKTYLADRVGELNLSNWDPLWQLGRLYPFNFGLFNIFRNNLHTDENIKYVLGFIKKKLKSLPAFYREDSLRYDIQKTVTHILDQPDGDRYILSIFEIARELVSYKKDEYFYVKTHRDSRDVFEQGEACKLLQSLYEKGDAALKEKVFELILEVFNLTEDDGDFSNHAPRLAFDIVKGWLTEDFGKRFMHFVQLMTDQYERSYPVARKKYEFKGWEYSGGGISQAGNRYHISDRHFVAYVLIPAIQGYYEQDKRAGWQLIKQSCISSEKRVSRTRPDFLNRSVYGIVLNRYADEDISVSQEAFDILSEFVLQRRGIPHKSDLVFQALSKSDINDHKKWRLIEVVTEKYKVPINPFMEKIVSDLAKGGFLHANEELKRWYANPDYYGRRTVDVVPVDNIRALLDTDLNSAISLFQTYISNNRVKSEQGDYFGAFDIASLLQSILKKDYTAGLSVVRSLEKEAQLSTQQQIIYSFSLFNHSGNDDSDNLELLMNVYRDVVDPFLRRNEDDIRKICHRLPWDTCREAFVQFSSRLVSHKKIQEALRIIEVFIKDPDPYLPGKNSNDSKDEYSEHARIAKGEGSPAITSTRGWCGWVLMKCGALDGRPYMTKIIELTEKLVSDENYYVIHMGCHALGQLANNRLTVLPDDNSKLFLNDDKETALRMAKRIESIGFTLLERLLTFPIKTQTALTKSVLHAISPIRSLNESDASKLIALLRKLPDEEIAEAASIFVFFAEFRKDAYRNWKFALPGLYDDLGPEYFDQKRYKKILLEVVRRLQEIKPDLCFHFAAVIEHLMRDPSIRTGGQDRYDQLALEYFAFLSEVYSHDVYTLIYQVIEDKLRTPRRTDYKDWFTLLVRCFKTEKNYYKQAVQDGRIGEVYWHPTLYHSGILTTLSERLGEKAFLTAAKIFFSFPVEINLNESEELVTILQSLSLTSIEVKNILNSLIEKHPTKYRLLRSAADNGSS